MFPADRETAGKFFISGPKSSRLDRKFLVISIACAKFPTRVGRENVFPAAELVLRSNQMIHLT
jgi:hypothetical protein